MRNTPAASAVRVEDRGPPGTAPAAGLLCPLPTTPLGRHALTADVCDSLTEAGCPLGRPVQDRLSFEALLAELWATFVNLAAHEVDSQIEAALRRIVEFLDIDRSGFGQMAAGRDQLVITHSYEVPGAPPSPRFYVDEQMPWYAQAIRRGEVIRLSRLPDDLPPEAVRERAYCVQTGLKSNLTIPLKVMGSVVGGIGFASFRGHVEWPDELVRRLRLVGEILTNALARKRADEALRDLAARLLSAQEEERRRIAREMHDDWTQRLAILSIDAARLEKHLGAPEAALPLLRAMQGRLVRLSEDVHDLSRQLHPSILDDLGLVEALRSECAGFARREGVAVAFRAEDIATTPGKDVALCVYRVAQEALRNAAKHAAVREVVVALTADGTELVLRVRDEGGGFDPAAARTRPGLGLSSMEERVRLARGRLSITSAPGRGTTVEVLVPLLRDEP